MDEATLFHRCRKALGLSFSAMARALLIAGPRNLQRWEDGTRPVSGRAWVVLEGMLRGKLEPSSHARHEPASAGSFLACAVAPGGQQRRFARYPRRSVCRRLTAASYRRRLLPVDVAIPPPLLPQVQSRHHRLKLPGLDLFQWAELALYTVIRTATSACTEGPRTGDSWVRSKKTDQRHFY